MPPYVGLLTPDKVEFESVAGYTRYDLSNYSFRVSPGKDPHWVMFLNAETVVWTATSDWQGGVPSYAAIFDDIIGDSPVSIVGLHVGEMRKGDQLMLAPGALCFEFEHTSMGSRHEAFEAKRIERESEIIENHRIMRDALAWIVNSSIRTTAKRMRSVAADALALIHSDYNRRRD